MKRPWIFVIAANAFSQEGQVTICSDWNPNWTAKDTLVSLLLLALAVAAFLGWRILESRLREDHPELPWRSLRKWIPAAMVLSGGLIAAAGAAGLLENGVGMAVAVAWALLNVPALVLLAFAAPLIEWLGPQFPLISGAALVWMQWHGLVWWIESKSGWPRFLSLR